VRIGPSFQGASERSEATVSRSPRSKALRIKERAQRSEPRERPAFAPKALRRARERVGKSEGRSPSDKRIRKESRRCPKTVWNEHYRK
jgi:hypothetical protein